MLVLLLGLEEGAPAPTMGISWGKSPFFMGNRHGKSPSTMENRHFLYFLWVDHHKLNGPF